MAAGIVLLVARFSSSPPFGLYVVQKAVLHKAHFFTKRTFTVIICAMAVGATNLFKAPSKAFKIAELWLAPPQLSDGMDVTDVSCESLRCSMMTSGLGRAGFFRLLRLGNRADLAHQAQLVLFIP